eukprot:353770-Pelagomonas_calceolata.AAC.1
MDPCYRRRLWFSFSFIQAAAAAAAAAAAPAFFTSCPCMAFFVHKLLTVQSIQHGQNKSSVVITAINAD